MYGNFFEHQHEHHKYFLTHGQKITYKKHQYIVTPMQDSPWVHFLAEGTVQAAFSFPNGAERLIGYFVPGMSFAKSGEFFKDSGGDLEYITRTDATLYRVSSADFFHQLGTNPAFNKEYMTWLLKTQILLIERVVYQGETTIPRKILRWLLFMAKYYGSAKGPGAEIQIVMTHDEIANFVHATRESVSKTLGMLSEEGYISIDKKRITICSLEKVRDSLE